MQGPGTREEINKLMEECMNELKSATDSMKTLERLRERSPLPFS